MAKKSTFAFSLGQRVTVPASANAAQGVVKSRTESIGAENRYLIATLTFAAEPATVGVGEAELTAANPK